MSRDVWVVDPLDPISANSWLYGNANPTTFLDPTGRYGAVVHHDLTFSEANSIGLQACHGGACALVYELAKLIAAGDQGMDQGGLTADPRNPHPELHFVDSPTVERNAERAARLGEPYLMGSVLHQVQDWYSHWNEGYRYRPPGALGHGLDSVKAGCLPRLGAAGWHIECHRPLPLIATFYVAHPFAGSHLSSLFSASSLSNVSDDKRIDLWLETFTKPGAWERGILGWGFDTDHFFGFTSRDARMRAETRDWLALFFFQLDPCETQSLLAGYNHPSEQSIMQFLLTGEYKP